MIKAKNFIFLLSLFFSIFLNSTYVISSCNYIPSSIDVYSSNNIIGNYKINTGGEFLKSVFVSAPDEKELKLVYIFNSTSDNCFSDSKNMKMKLLLNSMEVFADSNEHKNDGVYYYDTFTFTFNPIINLGSQFTSLYYVYNNQTDSWSNSYKLLFNVDSTGPIIDVSPTQKKINTLFFKLNQKITFDYSLYETLGSGLKSLSITSANVNYYYNGSKSNSSSFTDTLTGDKTYIFTATDLLDQVSTKTIIVNVDSEPPQISNFKNLGYKKSFGQRVVSFSIDIKDLASGFDTGIIDSVSANFSALNPSLTNLKPNNCFLKADGISYTCLFNNLVISFDETKTIQIPITLTDKAGNIQTSSFNSEIFIDKKAPQISSFYLLNSLGEKNIISSYDIVSNNPKDDKGINLSLISSYYNDFDFQDTKVYLKFKDDSFSLDPLQLQADFEGIDFIPAKNLNCTLINDKDEYLCVWTINDFLGKYKGSENGSYNYHIVLSDEYGNKAESSINITLDNIQPLIKNISLSETESLNEGVKEDGIISSGEGINFKIQLSDLNLNKDGKSFIYADFYNITGSEDYIQRVSGSCSALSSNTTTFECSFPEVKVRNGYVNTSVDFFIYDVAGNLKIEKYNLEILAISNKKKEHFSDDKSFQILSPISRNAIYKTHVVTWFEGNLTLIDQSNSDKINILNYVYIANSCDENDVPFIINEIKLYPGKDKLGTGNLSKDSHFIIKADLASFENDLSALNNTNLSGCQFSVLKRNSEEVLTPELVNFTLKFSFHEIPRGALLEANAKKILSMIDEVERIDSWHGDIYDIYHQFNQVCTTIKSVTGIIGTIASVFNSLVQIPIIGNSFTSAATYANSLQGSFSGNLLGFDPEIGGSGIITTMCSYVTCSDGGIFGLDGTESLGVGDSIKWMSDTQKALEEGMCTILPKKSFEDIITKNNSAKTGSK